MSIWCDMSWTPVGHIMGCKVCSLVQRNVTQWPKLVQYFIFQSFSSILSICVYHRVCRQYETIQPKCLFLLGPVYTHLGLLVLVQLIHLPAMCRAFPLGNFLHSHSPSLSLLLTDRTVLVGILCLAGCKRNVSRFSPFLHCYSPVMSTHSWTQVATSREHTKSSIWCLHSPSEPGREF